MQKCTEICEDTRSSINYFILVILLISRYIRHNLKKKKLFNTEHKELVFGHERPRVFK